MSQADGMSRRTPRHLQSPRCHFDLAAALGGAVTWVKLASDGFPPLWMRFEKFTNNLKCGFDGKSEREREGGEREGVQNQIN